MSTPPAEARRERLRELGGVALLLAVVSLPLAPYLVAGRAPLPDYLLYFAPWFTGEPPRTPWNPLWYDAVGQYWPWRTLLAEGLRANQVPLWNPFQFGGYAFCGNGQSALFYPLNWLCFGLFSVATGFRLTAVLHLWLAAFGTWRLVRELGGSRGGALVAGWVYSLGGFMVPWLMLPTLVSSAAWLPWAAVGIERCRRTGRLMPAVGAGSAVGLSALAGHPQVFYYVAACAGLLAAVRLLPRQAPAAAACLGLAGLLALPMVLPLLELAPRSHRPPSAAGDYAAFLGRAIPADRLLTLWLPEAFGSPEHGSVDPRDPQSVAAAGLTGSYWGLDRRGAMSPGDYTEFSLFIGLAAAALMLLGTARGGPARLYGLLGLAGLLLAFGTPLNLPLYHFLPGYASGAGPCRLAMVWTFGAAIAAGLGLDEARRQPLDRRGIAKVAGALVALLVAGWWLAAVGARHHGAGELFDRCVFRNLLGVLRGLAVVVTCLVLAARSPRWLPALVAAELVLFGWGYNPACPPELLRPRPSLAVALAAESAPLSARVAILDSPDAWEFWRPPIGLILPPNLATAAGLHDVGGYDSLMPADVKDSAARLTDGRPTPAINGNMMLLGRGPSTWPGAITVSRDASGTPGWSLGWGSPSRLGSSAERFGPGLRYDGANRVAVAVGGGHERLHDAPFPGWHAYDVRADGGVSELAWQPGPGSRDLIAAVEPGGQVRWVFQPMTVRLGLFAALVGLLLSGVGAIVAGRGTG